jgi:hypothetical protein
MVQDGIDEARVVNKNPVLLPVAGTLNSGVYENNVSGI